MPQTTVYIRKDDWEDWKRVPNKSEFIAMALDRRAREQAGTHPKTVDIPYDTSVARAEPVHYEPDPDFEEPIE